MKTNLKAKIIGGAIELASPNIAKRMLKRLEGKDVEVVIDRLKRTRSNRQNKYYWGVVIPLVIHWHKDSFGEKITKDEAHCFIYQSVLGVKPVIKEIQGCEVVVFDGKRLSECSTIEFEGKMEDIRSYFAPKGLVIPEPNQDNFVEDFLSN